MRSERNAAEIDDAHRFFYASDCAPSLSSRRTEPSAVRIRRMKTILYGIKNCDTMKKARAWLDSNGVPYEFHDYKISGIDRATLGRWANVAGWEILLNRAGTTFRKLPEQQKSNLTQSKAIELMIEQPSMIKRPVLARGKTLLVGFSPEQYSALK